MDLIFEDIFDAGEEVRPAGTDWAGWFEDLPRQPMYAALWSGPQVNGHRGAKVRVGGFFREPTRSVVGLHPFDDAMEGQLHLEGGGGPVPYAFFEIEKIIRMMLHRSHLAFEILASPARLRPPAGRGDGSAARDLVRWSIAADLADVYRDTLRGTVDDLRAEREVSVREALRLVRRTMTGVALGEGRAVFDVQKVDRTSRGGVVTDLLDREPSEEIGPLRDDVVNFVEESFPELDASTSRLPSDPDAYETLNQWLVDQRLSTS
jgi:hypothetical protein